MDYLKDPRGIEEKSMEIIESELGKHSFNQAELSIVKRVIHTTADFEYKDIIHFGDGAIDEAIKLLLKGTTIYTDTQMISAGINKKALDRLGIKLQCFVHDEEVRRIAKENNITRSMAGIDLAVSKGIDFYVFGNAPTALYRLIEHTRSGLANPRFVIAAPVGFVGAVESKEECIRKDIKTIAILGRKGGSTVATSIINALMYMVVDRSDD